MKLEKKRYILFHAEAEGAPLSPEQVKHAVYDAVVGLWGEAGASTSNAQLVEFDPTDNRGIICCSRGSLDSVIAALALKARVQGQQVALRPALVSGTIATLSPRFPNPKKRGGRAKRPGKATKPPARRA